MICKYVSLVNIRKSQFTKKMCLHPAMRGSRGGWARGPDPPWKMKIY